MKPESDLKVRALEIDRRLSSLYPKAKTALLYGNPLELLVATILSAQCTDERVNQVTMTLFKKYRGAQDYSEAPLAQLEEDIRPTGFFRNKAKSLKGCCKALVEKFGGSVPDNLNDMLTLPGVGRKTANLVLGAIYNVPGIVVDTHFLRLSQRLALTQNSAPVKIEYDIMGLLPESRWTEFSHELTLHGRAVCHARRPDCPHCVLRDSCPYAES
jgi:endonuclease-3